MIKLSIPDSPSVKYMMPDGTVAMVRRLTSAEAIVMKVDYETHLVFAFGNRHVLYRGFPLGIEKVCGEWT